MNNSNNTILNIAGSNYFKVAVNIAKTDTILMQEEKTLINEIATSQENSLDATYNSALGSAQNAQNALDDEANGLIGAGVTGALSSSFALGSLLIPNEMPKMPKSTCLIDKYHNDIQPKICGKGVRLSKQEGSSTRESKSLIDLYHNDIQPKIFGKGTKEINLSQEGTTESTYDKPNSADAPNKSEEAGQNELNNLKEFHEALTKQLEKLNSRTETQKTTLTNNGPTGNTTVDLWLGHKGSTPYVNGFCSESDQAHIESLTKEQLLKVKANVKSGMSELNDKISSRFENKRSNIAYAMNNYGQASGNLFQGIFKEEQAKSDMISKTLSAQNAIDEQINSSISNFIQQTDQAAGSYSEAGLSILTNLQTVS